MTSGKFLPPAPSTTPGALLEVRGLQVDLPTRHGMARAVRGVDFTLARGGTIGLVGESGCGKSLTAMALMGLLPEGARATGRVRFDGQELLDMPDAGLARLRGRRIAMVFQEPMTALNPVHTIGAQVAEPLRRHLGMARAEARARAVALLDRVGIPRAAQRFDAYPHEFSGGQRQRITIAMALACGPDVLIADEPTTALDATVQRQILELIAGLVAERGMALVLISHDLGVVAQNVERVLVMYGGSVVEDGPTREVFAHRAHPYTHGLFAARPRWTEEAGSAAGGSRARLPTIPGTVPEIGALPPGCPFAGRCAFTVADCDAGLPVPVEVGPAHHARCIRLEAVEAAQTAEAAEARR
ncbi:ABC transporter ATP-binding protein [Paracidovorax citrulli]|uniref:Oligopeptide/dipeptide ABC transporter, ATPase subunit n=2 Tax=Paracidovorax citrulli TaxID=80869 RepID=A1TT79_PARC0|nr:oligopeptide/dipeptide ABC transporter, ATPase subunit [Paracidovorax citrulli AAC00-1]PVY63611.1 peptide/nickel transport system ATP-binding protein [Paracidovorax citrulli]QCX09594.1 Oligopeptide transport ATP-binding protein OppD [Paracidovorax citrulli]REG67423.1 peptide/nickel transport system ATP-binding protein [Paracidovorax citrulli]RLJ91983.1 peptide/nickel transport system ATP-binding protein [Paracidovorax citrulli]